MRKILLPGILVLAIASCKERNTSIDYSIPPKGKITIDSQYVAQGVPSSFVKRILIEDFSGVHCANCPAAASKIEALITANPGKISDIVMYTHHAVDGSLTDSFPGSKSSYSNDYSDVLRGELGGPFVLPEVAINRRNFDKSQSRIVFSTDNLASNFNKESSQTSVANISFSKPNYDAASHTISLKIQVQYAQAISDSDYLSVALTESKLVDYQDSSGATDTFYVHDNVLRKYIYPQTGIILTSKAAGTTYLLSFNTTLPASWVTDNMKAVAILHKHQAYSNNYYVSQVNESPVK